MYSDVAAVDAKTISLDALIADEQQHGIFQKPHYKNSILFAILSDALNKVEKYFIPTLPKLYL
jgi:hypothetical protein